MDKLNVKLNKLIKERDKIMVALAHPTEDMREFDYAVARLGTVEAHIEEVQENINKACMH